MASGDAKRLHRIAQNPAMWAALELSAEMAGLAALLVEGPTERRLLSRLPRGVRKRPPFRHSVRQRVARLGRGNYVTIRSGDPGARVFWKRGTQLPVLWGYMIRGSPGRSPTVWWKTAATTRSGARCNNLPAKQPPMQ